MFWFLRFACAVPKPNSLVDCARGLKGRRPAFESQEKHVFFATKNFLMIVCPKTSNCTCRTDMYVQYKYMVPSRIRTNDLPVWDRLSIELCLHSPGQILCNIPFKFWPFYYRWQWMKSNEHDQTRVPKPLPVKMNEIVRTRPNSCSQAFARWNQKVKTSRMVFKHFSSVKFYWYLHIER